MILLLSVLLLATGTPMTSTPTYTYIIKMTDIDGNDQNIFHALNFTDCYQNITATAQAFQDKYPINPVIKNVTIFAMTLMATIQFNSTKCYPSAYENLFLP